MMLLGVDTGGTFTDFVVLDEAGLRIHKVLSTPDDPSRAILDGVRELGAQEALSRGAAQVVHGSTVATNATLEGKGVRTAYVTNRGFTDVLRIARQARSSLYDLEPEPGPDPVPRELTVGTGGRLDPTGRELEPLTDEDLRELRAAITALEPEAVAINLLYSYIDDSAERRIEAALEDLAFVCRSSYVLPEYKEYERGIATWLNAWLGPVVERYLIRLVEALAPSPVAVMQSSGGTISASQASRRAVNLLVSGPAGGLAAATRIGADLGRRQLLSFDMGGTSTDVAMLRDGPSLTDEGSVGPYPVAVPMADIHTIGAGGGSIAFLDSGGALRVGPQSAGADPGPACYGRGGTLPTVTDANVVLGRLPAELQLGGYLSMQPEAATAAVARVAEPLGMAVAEAAAGIIRIANEHMAQALRVISLERGFDPRDFSLISFGGAGGLHVCALADALEIDEIIVPIHSGVLSALGMLIAAPARTLVRTLNQSLLGASGTQLEASLADLAANGIDELTSEGVARDEIVRHASLDLRYAGQSFTINVPWSSVEGVRDAFHRRHETRYGHALALPIELVNLRLRLEAPARAIELPQVMTGQPDDGRKVPVEGIGAVPLRTREQLSQTPVAGPMILVDATATTLIESGWGVSCDSRGHVRLNRT